MHSVYMFYGCAILFPAISATLITFSYLRSGTNWGGINYPGAYTSYDYAASIRETRLLWEKYDEMKRQALFLRSSPQFRKTDWIGDTNNGIPGVTVNGTGAFVTHLRNPDSGTGFTVVRQVDAGS